MDSPGPRPCHHELMGGRDSSGLGAGKVAAEEQRNALTPEKVLAEALVIVQREGLTALTMRRLAAELGVRAPTVYWHVGNRQELLTRLGPKAHRRTGEHSAQGRQPGGAHLVAPAGTSSRDSLSTSFDRAVGGPGPGPGCPDKGRGARRP